jgi:hypothetical protein
MASCCLRRLPWLLLLAAACSSSKNPPLRIVIAHRALDSQCAPAGGAPANDDPLTGDKVATVRLSVRLHRPDNDVPGSFLCDRVFSSSEVPTLKLPNFDGGSLDIYGEAFADASDPKLPPRRIAVGALLDVPYGSKQLPDLRLYRDEEFGCVNARLARPRAFHSATLLPNGQVLLVGGLTANPDPNIDTFSPKPLYVAADIEIYDPATDRFTSIAEENGVTPAPRAFQQAALLNTTAPYKILLVGGLTVANTATPAMGMNTTAAPGTRLVPFDTSVLGFNPLATTAAGAELLTYSPGDRRVHREAVAGVTPGVFQGGAVLGNGLAVAGGIDWMGMPLAPTIPQVKQAAALRAGGDGNLEPARTGATVSPRMGATLTRLSDTTALLWGGQIAKSDPPGELVTGLGSGGTVTLASIAQAGVVPTQFHTATALPSDDAGNVTIVMTGGFEETDTNGGSALEPAQTNPVRLVTVSSQGMVAAPVAPSSNGFQGAICDGSAAMRYRPAGWEAAVLLPRNRVLVTGGSPTAPLPGVACNDCDAGNNLLCATWQAALFSAPSTFVPLPHMQVARFGHTATLLRDGNVLIVGGIGAGSDLMPRVLGDAEQYNPRPPAPLFTVGGSSPDPDDPIASDLADKPPRAPGAILAPNLECSTL